MIITKESHVDHGLTKSQIAYIEERFRSRQTFFVETVDLEGTGLGLVPCGLYGPIMGDPAISEDDVEYVRRGDRKYASRCIDKEPRMVDHITVIAGPHKDAETGEEYPCVLYTAFGGLRTPKEPDDPDMKLEEIEDSKAFWEEHALATPKEDVVAILHSAVERIIGLYDDTNQEDRDKISKGVMYLVRKVYGAVGEQALQEHLAERKKLEEGDKAEAFDEAGLCQKCAEKRAEKRFDKGVEEAKETVRKLKKP